MLLKELKKGDYFTRKELLYPKDNQVWIRGDYDRTTKRYSCINWSDINREIFLKGETKVYNEMIF